MSVKSSTKPATFDELAAASSASSSGTQFSATSLANFAKEAAKQGYSVERSELVRRFALANLAKNFVILTGNSGSGKSKLAQLFAAWIGGNTDYEFVAVGADWTDNRSVIGYPNPLRTVSDTDATPIFQATGVLKILNRAAKDWATNGGSRSAKPYFIILDEMNLSHVERYFSDFLAHMEAPGEPLRLHHETKCVLGLDDGTVEELDGKIYIPPNLFVIGTVNVDETTYMFSPKVLDRANVIEFKLSLDALADAQKDKPPSPPPTTCAESREFLLTALDVRDGAVAPPKTGDDAKGWQSYQEGILEVFQLLQRRNMEFGFRVQKEMLAYALADFYLHTSPGGAGHSGRKPVAPWDWRRCFDEQLMQKILPKFHGDQMKLDAILSALLRYCAEEKDAFPQAKNEAEKTRGFFAPSLTFEKLQTLDSAAPDPLTIRFPLSYAKLYRMRDTLARDQFVSYIA